MLIQKVLTVVELVKLFVMELDAWLKVAGSAGPQSGGRDLYTKQI